MPTILKVANVHFTQTGNNRLEYTGNGVVRLTANGLQVPVGTTTARPDGEAGIIRYNSTTGTFEGHNASGWGDVTKVDFGPTGVGANTYAASVGAAGNNYTITVGAAANTWANTISDTRAAASNTWANTISDTRAAASNTWANTISDTRAAASNTWANTISDTRAAASNNWANTVSPIGQQTIWIPAAAMYGRTTAGAASGTAETSTNRVMVKTLDFDTTTQEFAQFAIQMPKSWNESTLVCQFVWSHAVTTTNFGVSWNVAAVAVGNDDTLDAAFGTAVTVSDTGGTANDIYITSETSAMTVAGSPAAEEYVVFQVARDPANASDTLAIDARLHGMRIHYTIDTAKDD